MSRRPRLLDLYCGAGGAATGYHQAGFDIVGVDHVPQPGYPFPMVEWDVTRFRPEQLTVFDAIHASPPCQLFSSYQRANSHAGSHLNLIPQTRRLLQQNRDRTDCSRNQHGCNDPFR